MQEYNERQKNKRKGMAIVLSLLKWKKVVKIDNKMNLALVFG